MVYACIQSHHHWDGTRPRSTHRNRAKAQTTVTMECPIGFDDCYVVGEPKSADEYVSTSTITRKCTLLCDEEEPMTIYSIVHTKTVTFYGNRTDYTPPYSTIKTPVYCLEFEESPASSTAEGYFPEVTQSRSRNHNGFFQVPYAIHTAKSHLYHDRQKPLGRVPF